MSIERGTKTLVNASEGFRSVNEREDFAFVHDVLEIKYDLARTCNFTTVGDTIAEQPYAIGEDFLNHENLLNFKSFKLFNKVRCCKMKSVESLLSCKSSDFLKI